MWRRTPLCRLAGCRVLRWTEPNLRCLRAKNLKLPRGCCIDSGHFSLGVQFCGDATLDCIRRTWRRRWQPVPGAVSVVGRFGWRRWFWRLARRDFASFTRLEIWQGAGLGFFGGIGISFANGRVIHIAASFGILDAVYCVWVPWWCLAAREWPSKTLALAAPWSGRGGGCWRSARLDLRLGRARRKRLLVAPVRRTNSLAATALVCGQPRRAGELGDVCGDGAAALPVAVLSGNGLRSGKRLSFRGGGGPDCFSGGGLHADSLHDDEPLQQTHLASHASLIYACEPLITSVFRCSSAWLSRLAAVNYPTKSSERICWWAAAW